MALTFQKQRLQMDTKHLFDQNFKYYFKRKRYKEKVAFLFFR